jgi:hypothetical protein
MLQILRCAADRTGYDEFCQPYGMGNQKLNDPSDSMVGLCLKCISTEVGVTLKMFD